MRMAYDNADTALRFMASSYLELDPAQAEDMSQRIDRFHEWHRKSELPAYAALMRSASERAARGITADDVAWGLANLRARYRKFAMKAVEDAAPVLVTLSPDQIAALDRKFEDNNTKYQKDFLSADDAQRRRAQGKRMLERFRDFTGDLSPDQEARIELFMLAHQKHVEQRFEDRRQWQREVVAAIRTYRQPGELGAALAEIFSKPERRRTEAFIRNDKAWDDDLGQLIVELDRSLTPKQRAHVVRRLSDYANDFAALAREKEAA
jgi:Ribonuclease G/E